MIDRIKTAIQFAKNVRTTGALYETSRKVELEITRNISQKDQVVIEFGLGHGNITQEILSRLSPTANLYSFEINKDFCEHVRKRISDDRLTIINDGAQTIQDYIEEPVDKIISSIPITIFPEELKEEILHKAKKALSPKGVFSQIFYTRTLTKRLKNHFSNVEVVRLFNIPMEYVHHCVK